MCHSYESRQCVQMTMGFTWRHSWLIVLCAMLAVICTGLHRLPSFQTTQTPKQSGASSPDISVAADPEKRGKETSQFLQPTVGMKTRAGGQTPYPIPLAPKKAGTASVWLHAATERETTAAAGADPVPPTQHDMATTRGSMETDRVPDTTTTTFSDVSPLLEKVMTFVAGFSQTPPTPASVSLPVTPGHRASTSTLDDSSLSCLMTISQEHTSIEAETFVHSLHTCVTGITDFNIVEDGYCYYEGTEVRCVGFVPFGCHFPELPAHVRNFSFVGSIMGNLTRTELASLSGAELRVLRLPCNYINHLGPHSFADFPHLQWLDLSGNGMHQTTLRTGLESLNSSQLKRLDLNFMELIHLPDDFFVMFTAHSLDTLSLRGNIMSSFNSAVFAPFAQLRTLDLSHNYIFSVKMTSQLNVRTLMLTGNALFGDFHDLCLHQSPTNVTNAFSNLTSLYMDHNIASTIRSPLCGACFPNLVKLDISSSPTLLMLPMNFIAELPRLRHLVVNNMNRRFIFKSSYFKSLSLKTLTLRGNPNFDTSGVGKGVFSRCPNLEELTIADTTVGMSGSDMQQLLSPLRSLTSLTLENVTGLHWVLPHLQLWRFPKLQKLNLAENGLNVTTLSRALENVTSLRHLEIQHNDIVVLDESVFPWPLRRHLSYLDASENPLSCTCRLLWFKRWIEDASGNNSLKVHNYPSKDTVNRSMEGPSTPTPSRSEDDHHHHHYVCQSPASRQGQPLQEFQPSEEECGDEGTEGVVLTAVLAVCPVIMGMSLLGLVYRYRWHLRFYLYRCRRLRAEQVRGEDTVPYEYDVYVAYSDEDLEWVCEHLLPLLEGEEEHGLKAFVHDRDTLAGTVNAENIPRYMDQCARTMVLLSQAYLRHPWRLYEFQHIVYAAVEQEKDVVVVLLGDVEAGRLTREMRRMLTRGTFLQWGHSQEAQSAFRQGMSVALTTRETGVCETLC